MQYSKTIYLTPPLLSEDHISQKITCIRAHRERICRVEPEKQGSQVIFHNYGQGGAGWTFLFGCVYRSLAQLSLFLGNNQAKEPRNITVLGAGCYGLLTAILLARAGHRVKIVAADTHNLTSHKAAGFFFPRPRKSSTEAERALFLRYGLDSYRAYMAISRGNHPFLAAGALSIPAYYDRAIDAGFEPYCNAGLIPAKSEVIVDFGTGSHFYASEYQVIFMQTTVLMSELEKMRIECGIPLMVQEISHFNEISDSIIMNCAGLGAQKLTNDPRIVPVLGHLITLKDQPKQDHLKYLINTKLLQKTVRGYERDELLYYAPKESGILGITFLRGQSDPTLYSYEFDRLLERGKSFFGS